MFSDVVDCSLMFSGILTVLSSLDVKDESLSCLVSSIFFFQAFFPFLFFYFYFFWAIQPTQTLFIIFPLPPGGLKKKFFFNIRGRQVAGGSSDLLGCVCVGGPFSLPLSLFTLYHLLIVTISS